MLRHASPRLVNMIPWIFVAIGIFFIYVGQHNAALRTDRNNQTGLANQFYGRATNCFAAVSPTERTREHVNWCYERAEEATGYKGERYSANHE